MVDVFFWVTYIALWVLVIVLSLAVFLLYRYHGRMLLNSREGRATQGPDLYKPLPNIRMRTFNETVIQLGQLQARPLFIFFAQTTCNPCQEARAVLSQFAERYQETVETVLVCAGSKQEVMMFAANLPHIIQVVPDPHGKLFAQFRVSSTPFALITDQEGIVRGRGMPVQLAAFEWFIEQLTNVSEELEHDVSVVPVASIN